MNADARQMLADLGLERRDIVSAPDEVPRRHQRREDPREQAVVAAQFDARRQQSSRDDVGGGDERAARLRAWNTQATFETDGGTSKLENRWSGQGHRAALNRQQLSREDPWESIDARYGEERRLYLQERGAVINSDTSSGPRNTGSDRFFNEVLGGKTSTPHSSTKSPRRRNRDRAAPPPPRAPAHARAPSPRSFGTVRFPPVSHRIELDVCASHPVINAGFGAAAALRAAKAAQATSALQTDSTRINYGARVTAAPSTSAVNESPAQHPISNSLSSTAKATSNNANAETPNPNQIKETAVEFHKSSSEAIASPSSASSDTDDTAETAASSPPRPGLGTLAAVFFDVAGKFLGSHHLPVNVPVQATMNVTSRTQSFNPRDLIDTIESLARSMVDQTQGLEGVRLAEDGVWVED